MSRVKPRETISERIASAKSLRWLLARSGGRGTYHAFAMSDGAGTLPCWLRRESVCLQYGRPGFDPWVRKILWRRKWQPTPVPLPGKFHGQRRLVCYSPWGHKESDMTERLHFMVLAQEPLFPLTFTLGWAMGAEIILATLNMVQTKGIYSLVILTPPEEGNFCVPLEVARGDEDGVLMERGAYTPI